MSAQTPALVAISHGTSSAEGRAAVKGLRDAVEAALPNGPTVRLGHVDVEQPDVPATLATLQPGEPAVIVPLLLSAGYHVHVDLTDAVKAADDRPVQLAGALGPDDLLIDVLLERCERAGVRDDDVLVLAVAGSSDARAVRDCHTTAERFAARAGRDIRIGFLSASSPRLGDAVADARAAHPGRRVVAVSYLLAEGFFQGLIDKAGADVVTPPLLIAGRPVPRQLVEIVLDRYAAASGA
ncbi:MAG TPA: CbiX/SirB N-terminal domain-containing protein [Microbacterium sp.]|uniref:sirohydrochlorin chelatase n=1 Tax=Microbacterium sp. TaxID=51671 RepID=UPI002C834FD3|nr:CbiX/SirB N-terminal domain-containing protein [Microbacterium sp.]HWI30916.1 CbiX/SirB N-terminal domain-containing protein [Microbacterium sp.]